MARFKIVLIAALMSAAAGAAMLALASGTVKTVQANKATLRETASFFGKPVGEALKYLERVEVLQEKDDWSEVKTTDGRKGWVHSSSLTEKTLSMKATGGPLSTGVSREEVALAGKGFSPEVERQYRNTYAVGDYNRVDRMEKEHNFSAEALLKFLNEGMLKPEEGGAK